MSHPTDDPTLLDRRYATLIVRCTLDQHGRLILGELVDIGDPLPQRFVDLTGLTEAVEAWLRQREGGAGELPLPP